LNTVSANKNDWQTKPFPIAFKELPLEREFEKEEMEQIKIGLIPKQMEDKWFIYYEKNRLNFHRSWTGHPIFQLIFLETGDQCKVVKVLVNRETSEYNQVDDNYDIKFLNFLIDRLLLNKNIPFPKPDDIEDDKQAIYKHSMIGYGR
jgi:hypothetical protein